VEFLEILTGRVSLDGSRLSPARPGRRSRHRSTLARVGTRGSCDGVQVYLERTPAMFAAPKNRLLAQRRGGRRSGHRNGESTSRGRAGRGRPRLPRRDGHPPGQRRHPPRGLPPRYRRECAPSPRRIRKASSSDRCRSRSRCRREWAVPRGRLTTLPAAIGQASMARGILRAQYDRFAYKAGG
jgi:hypothetical protein